MEKPAEFKFAQSQWRLHPVRTFVRERFGLVVLGGILSFVFFCAVLSGAGADDAEGADGRQSAPSTDGGPQLGRVQGMFNGWGGNGGPKRRLFLKVGGVPQEGFGSTLQFFRDGVRMAGVLNMDFAAVKTFDLDQIGFDYNVINELNTGIDFQQYNWNNMCNLHNTVTRFGGHEDFPVRVARLRKEVQRFSTEAEKASMGEKFDGAYIEEVRKNLSGCDIVIFADQDIHQSPEWDRFTRDYTLKAVRKIAHLKLRQRKATPVKPKDLHVHYRWGDVVKKIKEHQDDSKWNFDNVALQRTIESTERCLGRSLSTNIFMKRSERDETVSELRSIVAPIQPSANFIQGEDDIVDLFHLSQSKILAVTGGTYSSVAAAIGEHALVIHNGWHPKDYDHLLRWGVPYIEQGLELTADMCQKVKERF